MGRSKKVTLLDSFKVVPSSGTISELSAPLTCSDMLWVGMAPIHRLTFYQLPLSTASFLHSVIPGLANSLSLALNHFPSPAGNLIIHSEDPSIPEIRYVHGNSVPFSVAKSSLIDFEYLVSNQPRICSEFYPLVPDLPKYVESGGARIFPLISIQVTLFPEHGFCIGITHNHVLGDGIAMYSFLKTWSTICKSGGNEVAKSLELPSYDREMIRMHTEILDNIFWDDLRKRGFEEKNMVATLDEIFEEESDKMRTTCVISLEEIQKLKKHVSGQRALKHLSTFTVVCAYAWTCLVKSGNATRMNEVDDDEQEYFIFMADCRGRTDPMIPANYFGNCIAQIQMGAKNRELSGEEGLVIAAELIGESIQKRLQYDGGVLKCIETFLEDLDEVKNMVRLVIVAGFPRQNHYELDFGWGKPRKVEITSIDAMESLSLSGTRDGGGGIEIGFVLPRKRMDVFVDLFRDGLQAL